MLAASCPNGAKFSCEAAAEYAVVKGADGTPYKCPRCPWWHLKRPAEHTGFTTGTKLLIRRRAGGGDPVYACCECCGRYLGQTLGEIQHVIARGMGGTSLEIMNSAANAALLCGSAIRRDGCHGAAEARSALIGARGFFVLGRQDPRAVSMILASGRAVWRSEDGAYLDTAPVVVAA
jgi:hypothetical protein